MNSPFDSAEPVSPTTSISTGTGMAAYIAAHVLHSVLRLAGSTSVSLDPRDPVADYVTSNGGLLNPPDGGVQPGRLVRLTVHH